MKKNCRIQWLLVKGKTVLLVRNKDDSTCVLRKKRRNLKIVSTWEPWLRAITKLLKWS